ncbi:hypothetical protein COL47_22360 [Bacillus toyonensis]|uniref:hypothetical protein n=1 Tax=Bacillus toyonensis TaxID=155322 RepID=UPI000BF58C1A|nr:hypothetical protein [Bacillus toyonensis]PFY14559.1 hypothetical protein COL47_22360 [Bacillus toyonensis]
MSKKWKLANAVKKFTPHQKTSLMRNKGNLNKHEFNSLIKEMDCYYESVRVEGKGRERVIYTDKKRKVKAQKEDRRQLNKGIAPPHSKHLALMVMSKIDGIDNKARTRNDWSTCFGLISSAEKDIMSGIYSEEALKPYKEFMIRLGIMEDGEEKVFQDLAYTLSKVAKGQLQTVLDQAEKMKLISRISSWKGKVKGSKEPIEIDEFLALEIKSSETELLKKYEISKIHSLMFKNCPKTKAFKAEWLEYIENVEDAEGDAMHLQYIYEVFRIEVSNKYAFDEYIKVHYPTEIDSFDLLENEQAYHSKLFDYVVKNAQKRHEKSLNSKKLTIDENTKEVLAMFNMTEEEAIAQTKEAEIQRELTLYEVLLKSVKYVDCIRNLHIQLHGMSVIESEEVKAVKHMIDEYMREELAQLELSSSAEVESEKSLKKSIRTYHESCMNKMEQPEKLTKKEKVKQHQTHQAQQSVTIATKQDIENDKLYDAIDAIGYGQEIIDYEYLAAMEDIRAEIREYEDKYGDKAMEHMTLDTIIGQWTRKVTAQEIIAEYEHQKQREHKEWEKKFEGGQSVKWERTTNNPLEVFNRIRYGRI